MEYEQGVRNIIATPHYRDQMFDTPIRTIRSQFALVEKCVQEFNQELAKEDRESLVTFPQPKENIVFNFTLR